MNDIVIRREGKAGRITLNRPAALNALTHGMVIRMSDALDGWADDPAVELVVVDAAGGKAFCAGGDLRAIYEKGSADPKPARRFWADEYRLNARIARYPKPYVAVMDGIVMGGGVGISAHGSHRIVTERTTFAMPEVTIGFMPDVGGTWLLGKSPGLTGLYLGLTGAKLNAADAVLAGFADHFVRTESLPALIRDLCETGEAAAAIADHAAPPSPAELRTRQKDIAQAFSHDTVLACLAALLSMDTAWSRETLATLRRNSPFSIACAFEAIRQARSSATLEDCLRREYRFAWRSPVASDFIEGIRAAIIDRDRQPRWNPPRLEDVDPARVAAMLAPLGDDELQF